MGEAGNHCPIPRAKNTSKFQNAIFIWMFQISTQQKKIILHAYHFITDYVLRELIFTRHVTDTNLPKRKFMANYNKKSCKTKNLNFSWAQILTFFVSHLQDIQGRQLHFCFNL